MSASLLAAFLWLVPAGMVWGQSDAQPEGPGNAPEYFAQRGGEVLDADFIPVAEDETQSEPLPDVYNPQDYLGGPEIRMNSTLSGPQDDARAAELEGGGFAVVWMDRSLAQPDPSGWGIRARIFTADGTPAGADFIVNSATGPIPDVGGDQVGPDVAALADGGFVIAWRSIARNQILGRTFDAAGAATSNTFRISDTNDTYDIPRIAGLTNGDFTAVWSARSPGDGSFSGIRARIFAPDGTARGASFTANSITGGYQILPDVAALTGGGFAVAWNDNDTIRARVFWEDGSPLAPDQTVNPTSSLRSRSGLPPTIDPLTSGGFVVTWSANIGVMTHQFDASGGSVTTAGAIVNQAPSSNASLPEAAGLADGNFALVWRADHSIPSLSYSPADVGGRVIDPANTPVSAVFAANPVRSGDQISRFATRLGNGFLVVWTTASGDISGRIFTSTATHTLTIFFPGTRPGRVHDLANGIDCSTDCVIQLPVGAALSLTRTTSSGNSFFTGWMGDCSGSAPTCAVTLDQDRIIGARFFPTISITAPSGTPVLNPTDPVTVEWTGGDPLANVLIRAVHFPSSVNPNNWQISSPWKQSTNDGTETFPRPVIVLPQSFDCSRLYRFSIQGTNLSGGVVTATRGGAFRFACPPSAVPDQITLGEDDGLTDLSASLLSNDIGTGLTLTGLTNFNGSAPTGVFPPLNLANGVISIEPGGFFNFLAAGESELIQFSYEIADTAGGQATALASVWIDGVNDSPSASDDAVDVNRDDAATDLTQLLLQTDDDPDTNDVVTISAIDTTGTVGLAAFSNGTVTYDPNGAFDTLTAGQTATDSFTYTISDGQGGSDTATVTVTVHGTNTPPTANPDTLGVGSNPFTALADFQVNETSAKDQLFPDLATLSNGNFVVTWIDYFNSDAVFNDGFARYRIYNPDGAPLTGELDAHPDAGNVDRARIAALAGGGFVIVWQQAGGTPHDNWGWGILARVFDTHGTAVSGIIPVNSWITNDQFEPDVAALSDGGFAVSWSDISIESPDSESAAITSRRFTADGTPVGANEFQVNTHEAGQQSASSIAGLMAGGYVIAWTSDDGNAVRTHYRLFEADDTPRTAELPFDQPSDPSPGVPHLAPHSSGGFLLTPAVSSTSATTRAALYTSAGVYAGTEYFTTPATASHSMSFITELAGNEVLIVWAGNGDDIASQIFDTSGSPATSMEIVNTTVTGQQAYPASTALHHGGYAVAWTDFEGSAPDLDQASVRMRVFRPESGCPANAVYSVSGDPDERVNEYTTYQQRFSRLAALDAGFVVVWEDLVSTDGAIEPREIVRARIYQSDGSPLTGEFVATVNTAGAQFNPDVARLADNRFAVSWEDESDGSIRARIFLADGTPATGDLQANTSTDGRQVLASIGALEDGGFVVAWGDASHPGGDPNDLVLAQRFNAAGAHVGGEFRVNETDAGENTLTELRPNVIGLSGGGFAINWVGRHTTGADTDDRSVRSRVYNAAGVALGGETVLNTTTVSAQGFPGGEAYGPGFVSAWADFSRLGGDASGDQVRIRQFNSDGSPRTSEVRANTTLFGNQTHPRVAVMPDGGYVVVYQDGTTTVRGRYVNADNQPVGSDFIVMTDPQVHAQIADVAALDGDRFVVTWTESVPGAPFPGDTNVHVRVLTGTCTPPELLVAEGAPVDIPVQLANQTHLLDLLSNDTDADGDTLSFVRINGLAIQTGTPFVLPSGAILTLESGQLRYDPRPAAYAIALGDGDVDDDNFTYTITDGRGGFASADARIWITGVNDDPTASAAFVFTSEDSGEMDLTPWLTGAGTDPDGDTLTVSAIDTAGTTGLVTLTASASAAGGRGPTPASAAGSTVSYDPAGRLDHLGDGEVFEDVFGFSLEDPSGSSAPGSATVYVFGQNDAPAANDDALSIAATAAAVDVTALLLLNDTDPDQTDLLEIVSVDMTGTMGSVTFNDATVTYDPTGAFDALQPGQESTDSFAYTLTDPHGVTASATVTVTVRAIDVTDHELTVSAEGLGSGTVTAFPAGISCGALGSECSGTFSAGTMVMLTATPETGSRFDGWTQDCRGIEGDTCRVAMTEARSVGARFAAEEIADGRIVAATLPGARSGVIGGTPVTVFMSVVSRQSTPAQACAIDAGDSAITLSYVQVDGANQPVGEINPVFDLPNGGIASFILILTGLQPTDEDGLIFHPRVICDNAELAPIEGVNSVFLTFDYADTPDLLSIGVTPSGDGVVRIPATGNRISFMSAAAVNIGAGDGSAGAGQATVTVSVDTGAAVLPVTLEVCETPSTGGCITPRGTDTVSTVFDANIAKFFAVFVRAGEGANIAFDPANARVFLRFVDANGVTRSATSAAISAPLPSDQPVAAPTAGRWSVLLRQDTGDWPSLRRASLYVFEDGTALLDDGETIILHSVERIEALPGFSRFAFTGFEGIADDHAIRAGDALDDQPGAFWGVRDARSDRPARWADIAGDYGSLRIGQDGSISGTLAGCIVSGTGRSPEPAAPGLLEARVSLMGCVNSGSYRAVADLPANDRDRPRLVVANGETGWVLNGTR
ncbi:Ig-like domain-containing protein [Hyphobacterium vulgare]|uniref:Ig-like domain-containing protein n=1 Tax=Hyphobacterium vulgare TaxID=1736751 RepID=A0ABV7A0D3_9PROT